MHNFVIITVLFILTIATYSNQEPEGAEVADRQMQSSQSRLSRKKRYLTFPSGSSLQLVYCLTMPTVSQGNIFTMGGTAAVAWELPTDSFITMRKKFRDVIKKRTEKIIAMMQAAQAAKGMKKSDNYVLSSQYTNENKQSPQQSSYSSISYPVQYHNNQSSYYDQTYTKSPTGYYQKAPSYNQNIWNNYYTIGSKGPRYSYKYDSPKSNYYKDEDYLDYNREYENQYNKEVHRRTRRELYSKIEKFFLAQNKDGKSCLLKAICEVSQTSENELGSFVQEILKAIFTVKSHEHFEEENDEYDRASSKDHNCSALYPKCPSSVWKIF